MLPVVVDRLRSFVADDAPFVLDLVIQPSWIAHIGDQGVHDLDGARRTIEERLRPSTATDGFGFWCIEALDGTPMGLCGIVRRRGLDAPDLGYALRPAFWGHGYAREAATETVRMARDRYGLDRLVAIVTPANAASVRLLEAIGVRYERAQALAAPDGGDR